MHKRAFHCPTPAISALRLRLRARGSPSWRAMRHKPALNSPRLKRPPTPPLIVIGAGGGRLSSPSSPFGCGRPSSPRFAASHRMNSAPPSVLLGVPRAQPVRSLLGTRGAFRTPARPPLSCPSPGRAEGLGSLLAMVTVPWQRADAAGTPSERDCRRACSSRFPHGCRGLTFG